jgi:predicted dehydrogenase
MKRKYKAAISGLGNIAYKYGLVPDSMHGSLSHFAALDSCEETIVVAGCSPCEEERVSFERLTGVRTYGSYSEMLRCEEPDLVSICSPTDCHFSQALEAIEAGVPMVWLEKPPATNCDEICELLSAKKRHEHQTTIVVGYQRRYSECYVRLKSLLDQRSLGDCFHVELQYSKGLETNGVHIVDVLFYLFGNLEFNLDWVQRGELSNPSFMMSMQSGIPVAVIGSDVPYHSIDLRLLCEKGRLSIEHGGMSPRIEMRTEHELFPGYYRLQEVSAGALGGGGFAHCFERMLEDLISSHREGREPVSSLYTASSAQGVVEGVRLWTQV